VWILCGIAVTKIERKIAETQWHSSGSRHVRSGERWPQYRWWYRKNAHIRAPARQKPRSRRRYRRKQLTTPTPTRPHRAAAPTSGRCLCSGDRLLPKSGGRSSVTGRVQVLPPLNHPLHTLLYTFIEATTIPHPPTTEGFSNFALKIHRHRRRPEGDLHFRFWMIFRPYRVIIVNRVRSNCMNHLILFLNIAPT